MQPCHSVGWRGTRQRFSKLPDAAFDQQAPGQLDQVKRGNRPQPLGLQTLRPLPLSQALGQRTVVTFGIAFEQCAHLRRLCLPEAEHRCRRIEPAEEQVAGKVLTLLECDLLRPEVT
ncbi:hypothetical protein D3C72_1473880 [compost metagenome]